jgi:hypothetical protein
MPDTKFPFYVTNTAHGHQSITYNFSSLFLLMIFTIASISFFHFHLGHDITPFISYYSLFCQATAFPLMPLKAAP